MILHHLPFDSSCCEPRSSGTSSRFPAMLAVTAQKALTVPAGLTWKEKEAGNLSAGQLNYLGALRCLQAAIRRFADGDIETIK